MRLIRVFARKTNATPTDDMAFYDEPGLFIPDADEVHVSCTFTADIPRAEWLLRSWQNTGLPVKIGGPAFNDPGEAFVPGRYLKYGYVITSRGCPNNCWFCSVPNREGPTIRELPITDGWNLLDDNLLACSDDHIKAVFNMLKQYGSKVEFTGGLEAARLKPWHVDALTQIKPKQMFFAYDTPDDYEPLLTAGKLLKDAGITIRTRKPRCYVLIGYPRDTLNDAEYRLKAALQAGFIPMAMLYKSDNYKQNRDWRTLQREWARPALIMANRRVES